MLCSESCPQAWGRLDKILLHFENLDVHIVGKCNFGVQRLSLAIFMFEKIYRHFCQQQHSDSGFFAFKYIFQCY